ncbi:putative uncharacterized protein [Vibrio anguillarum]|nr:putative uncharacterized protein [Vibrio anguillarum]
MSCHAARHDFNHLSQTISKVYEVIFWDGYNCGQPPVSWSHDCGTISHPQIHSALLILIYLELQHQPDLNGVFCPKLWPRKVYIHQKGMPLLPSKLDAETINVIYNA